MLISLPKNMSRWFTWTICISGCLQCYRKGRKFLYANWKYNIVCKRSDLNKANNNILGISIFENDYQKCKNCRKCSESPPSR